MTNAGRALAVLLLLLLLGGGGPPVELTVSVSREQGGCSVRSRTIAAWRRVAAPRDRAPPRGARL